MLTLLECYKKGEDPAASRRVEATNELHESTQEESDEGPSDTDARLRAITFSLGNLIHPIKLIRRGDVESLGRFPRYDEEFDFAKMDSESVTRCVAISHRWTDDDNSRSDLDAKWLITNWPKLQVSDDALFFYDFTSLPQKRAEDSGEMEPAYLITFKAGLELIDHLFSKQSVIIPSENYLFRYWCYIEFFIADYNDSMMCGVPFVDPLPRDLKTLDMAIDLTHKSIVNPGQPEIVVETIVMCHRMTQVMSVGTGTKKDLIASLMSLSQMEKGSKCIVLKEFIRVREAVAGMIRSRIRQCSITRSEDKGFLESLLASYLERKYPSDGDLVQTFRDTDTTAAADAFQSQVQELIEQAQSQSGRKRPRMESGQGQGQK